MEMYNPVARKQGDNIVIEYYPTIRPKAFENEDTKRYIKEDWYTKQLDEWLTSKIVVTVHKDYSAELIKLLKDKWFKINQYAVDRFTQAYENGMNISIEDDVKERIEIIEEDCKFPACTCSPGSCKPNRTFAILKPIKEEIIQLYDKVKHPEIYNGNEVMTVIGIREDELELQGDWSGGTHNVCQRSWFKKEGCIKIK